MKSGVCTEIEQVCYADDECDANAECMLTGGNKFKCKCRVGWAGNGLICGIDSDIDGWSDVQLNCTDAKCKADNCPKVPNSGQDDINKNGVGDVCDLDADGDGTLNKVDNCPLISNPDQADGDSDGVGDACDNCPSVDNRNQIDTDEDGAGDKCDNDTDNDGNPCVPSHHSCIY